jgi:hypothetical protein
MANVKVFADRQTDRQTDRRTGQKLYAPDLSIRGHNNTSYNYNTITTVTYIIPIYAFNEAPVFTLPKDDINLNSIINQHIAVIGKVGNA